jgi:predicted deacylase
VNAKLANAFSAPFTLHSKYRPKSLRQAAAKLGKRVLVYEGGESSRFDEMAIQFGVDGTIKVLRHLEMTDRVPQDLNKQSKVIWHSSWVRAKVSGIFQSTVSNGEAVLKNQPVGFITDPFGDFRLMVKSPAKGYVIGLNNNPLLHQGDAAMHIGVIQK